ncbi:flagellar biosynthetic protein FliO [Methylobacillus caricis]|uniref:flagellar biosynthetic protein FliO n=1 Tax=Methylobacillus caricis TaxID=1971611 RepID=UPI001CFFC65A|nr:flagellar biosynthetic protein FliO [Methylobacillus caricis]MCB5188000.1 flagellar biosynthetic protein FliO [Methylobacillus caricis]
MPILIQAAETQEVSPTGSLLRMILGLAIVLGVMVAIAWLMKRMTPGLNQHQSVARIVGGVNVGSREKVVVVQVADRWIVVGVAPGQVSSLANLEAGADISAIVAEQAAATPSTPFSAWLKKAISKKSMSENP